MLRVNVLGEQVIVDDATGVVQTRSSRSIALIAYLAAHAGIPQPRHQIARLFWPDSSDSQSLTNLRRELHQLHSLLREDASLSATPSGLCWEDSDSCRVDARVFAVERDAALRAHEEADTTTLLDHAQSAITAYRGDLLPGSPDEWILDLRAVLARQCADLCDLVADVAARGGDLVVAVDAARFRIRVCPLEEGGYRTLMRLQADLGDRAGAISTYHHCASVLERELGLDPDASTRELFQRLLDFGEAPPPTSSPRSPAGHRTAMDPTLLVGRAAELQTLLTLWHEASEGHPQLVLISGEVGVGKTRLMSEVAAAVRSQGVAVAGARCFGSSGDLPLAPVADWLRDPAMGAAIRGLDPIWRTEVERLVPSASGSRTPATGARAKADAWQRHRFFESVARVLAQPDRPTMLVLDNLQWCDEETLSLLAFCLQLAADAPILAIATVRTEALIRDPLSTWIDQLQVAGLLAQLPLRPLEADQTARLAETLNGHPLQPSETKILQETTGGFPLYVVEASRAMVDVHDSPTFDGIAQVLQRRLEQATPLAREVGGLAAAVGRDFSLQLITEASDHSPDEVVRAIDELWRLRIIREQAHGYDYSHDLLRDAAYAQASPPQRWLFHRRLAQALELLHGDARDDVSAQLAGHYARGGFGDRAMSYYRRAADVAARTFASTEAIRLYREALAMLYTLPTGRSRDTTELEIWESLTSPLNAKHGYSSPELQEATQRCLTLAEGLVRRDSIVTSLIGLWTSHFVQGHVKEGHRLATRALTLADPGGELEGQAHFAVAGSSLTLGDPAGALTHFEIACTMSKGAPSLIVGSRPEIHALAWSAHAHWLLGDPVATRGSAQDAIFLARAADHPYSLAVALAYAGVSLQVEADREALSAVVKELGELCDRFDFAYYREWGAVLHGWLIGGHTGSREIHRAVDALKAARSLVRMPYWLSLQADVLAQSGEQEAARATLDAALTVGRANGDLWWLPELMRQRATYDNAGAGVARLREGCDLARRHGSIAHISSLERSLAERGLTLTDVRPAPGTQPVPPNAPRTLPDVS